MQSEPPMVTATLNHGTYSTMTITFFPDIYIASDGECKVIVDNKE